MKAIQLLSKRKALIVCTIVVLLFGAYLYRQTKNLLLGPNIKVTSPLSGTTVDENLITLTGRVKRIDHLFLNDGKIFTDESGRFDEKLLLSAGYNLIQIEAKDRFGRETQEVIELVYEPQERKGGQKLARNKSAQNHAEKN